MSSVLKVSFFGPFYGAYNIMALDQDAYRFAMVCGPNTKYLWILCRERSLDAQTLAGLVGQAREAGFPVDQLIYVDQTE